MASRIVSLANELHAKKISAVELTKSYLDKIENTNSKSNAYVHICPELALVQAEKADKMIADGIANCLTGIPMSIKDSIVTKGIPTTACSKMLENYNPSYNATAYTKLIDNGAVMLGKTNMDNFSMGSSSLNGLFGPCSNPYNTSRVCGGSSGGSAASVAEGSSVYSLGADAGGSTRQPASYCGLVGLKPSFGSVSRNGLIALGSSLEQIGPLAQCVEDAQIIFNAIRGKDPFDGVSHDFKSTTVSNPVIGIMEDKVAAIANEDTKRVFYNAVNACKSLGYDVVKIQSKYFDILPKLYIILCYAEIASNMGRYSGIGYGHRPKNYEDVSDFITKARTESFPEEVRKRIMFGNYILSSEQIERYYYKAAKLRKELVNEYKSIFNECDFILSPTTPTPAFAKDYQFETLDESAMTNIFTLAANLVGHPSISIPFGMSSDGLPIGILLDGKMGYDDALLEIAKELENYSEHKGLGD